MAASQTSRPGRTRQGTRVRYHSPAMFAWGVFAAALATSAMVGSAPSRAAADLGAPAVVKAVQWGRPGSAATRMPALRARGRGSRTALPRLRPLA
jgi:hypothetical protein